MPPLKEGLKKRKHQKTSKINVIDNTKIQNDEEKIDDIPANTSEDLLKLVNDEEADSTDSEGDVEESDGELEKPIFDTDEDDDLSFESSSPGEDSEDEDEGDKETDDDEGSESGFEQDSSDDEASDSENVKEITISKNVKGQSKRKESKAEKKNSNVTTKSKEILEKKQQNSLKINDSKKNCILSGPSNNKPKKNIEIDVNDKKEKVKSSPVTISQKNNKKGNLNGTGLQKPETTEDDDKVKKDEYLSDSSDEEDRRNTIGDVPLHWYKEYPHIGYDLDGKQILKPLQRDQIEEFLKRCEDPDFWRTVNDPLTGQDVILSKADLEILARLRQGKTPDPSYDDYPEWVEWFSSIVLPTPVRAFPEHKRSFLPSQLEQRQVNRLVRALRAGWIKTREQDRIDREKKKETRFYMLWSSDDRAEEMRRIRNHIPAPRRALPGHAESYNPPPEYLLDDREMKQWKRMENRPWKRKYTFLPQKFGSLREVPAYSRFTRERFLRCLDLYLAPRAIKMRLTIDPHQLVPKLPNPQDLQPFPTHESMVYRGHTDIVRCIDVDPTGQYLYSGCDDGTVKIWEVSTGRCLKTTKIGDEAVKSVQSTPVTSLSLLAVACGQRMLLFSPGTGVGDHKVAERTDELLAEAPDNSEYSAEERIRTAVQWETVSPEQWTLGIRISVSHFKEVKQVVWHGRGDYVCVVLPEGANRSVVVHQVSRRRSQLPFSRAKGMVQCALFHPIRPFLFVATQRIVRVYDLVKQELVKKLLTSAQWISCMAIHPAGDNLLVASYDRKMMWFDLDLSSKPYQTLRLHSAAVRGVAFHKRYPLFASGSDDRKLIISHGMVYNDLLQNPLIVPLKQLQTHEAHEDFGILGVTFHPLQPWVFSAGADQTIRLYT